MIRVVHLGSRIRMLTFSHPGSRGQKGTQSRIRIRNTGKRYIRQNLPVGVEEEMQQAPHKGRNVLHLLFTYKNNIRIQQSTQAVCHSYWPADFSHNWNFPAIYLCISIGIVP